MCDRIKTSSFVEILKDNKRSFFKGEENREINKSIQRYYMWLEVWDYKRESLSKKFKPFLRSETISKTLIPELLSLFSNILCLRPPYILDNGNQK